MKKWYKPNERAVFFVCIGISFLMIFLIFKQTHDYQHRHDGMARVCEFKISLPIGGEEYATGSFDANENCVWIDATEVP